MSICEARGVSFFFFSSRRRHTRFDCDWSSDVCSSDLPVCRAFSGKLPSPLGRGLGEGIEQPEKENHPSLLLHSDKKEKSGCVPSPGQIGRASCRERV